MAKVLLPLIPSFKALILHLSLLAFASLKCVSMEPSSNFTFFMHDILGGSSASERIVAGITITQTTHKLPFSKPNNRIFPIPSGIPLADNTDTTVGNNIPNPSTTSTVISSIGTHDNVVIDNRNTLPFVKPGTLPLGATLLDKVLFGRITVIDYEVTQESDLGSQLIGKAQGFHLASSLDGSSKTMAFTVLFGDEEDTISFFGVHRTAVIESSIAVVGGTGKYGNAKGYAKLEILHPLPDQQTSNGVETTLQTTVYLTL